MPNITEEMHNEDKLKELLEKYTHRSGMVEPFYAKEMAEEYAEFTAQKVREEIITEIKQRIDQSNMLMEQFEKGNDLNGGDIQEQWDHESSSKIVLESLLSALTQDKEGLQAKT